MTRLQGENSRVTAECGRLKEDNEKLARSQSELQDHTNRMKDDLKSKHSRPAPPPEQEAEEEEVEEVLGRPQDR